MPVAEGKPTNFLEMYKSNHNTVSVCMSLDCDDENWIEGLKEDELITQVDFFFEEGTPGAKVDKHWKLAESIGLFPRNTWTVIPKEQIEDILKWTEKVGGIVLKKTS